MMDKISLIENYSYQALIYKFTTEFYQLPTEKYFGNVESHTQGWVENLNSEPIMLIFNTN